MIIIPLYYRHIINQMIDGRTKPRHKGDFSRIIGPSLPFVIEEKVDGFPPIFVREASAAMHRRSSTGWGKRNEARIWLFIREEWTIYLSRVCLLCLRETYFPLVKREVVFINRFWRYDLQRGIKYLN